MKLAADHLDTIVALATPPGVGAIGVIRLSGPKAIEITDLIFKGKTLANQKSHTIHFGTIMSGDKTIDEVLISLFKAPTSYTKEDVVEISCHGSPFIINELIKTVISRGARLAKPGEFTQRAFLNGQLDLAQAEAVADLIASESEKAHQTAIKQMRGGFSEEIKQLREQLVHFASMIELELDFSEEDVEFADRDQLKALIDIIIAVISALVESFQYGNVIKNGIPTVIVGKPNAGKSTLLNCLLKEEKAIVSDIAGTTRDSIEDELYIQGINFRFIDTAGLREAEDKIEAIGVERTLKKIEQADLVLFLFDLRSEPVQSILTEVNRLEKAGKRFIPIGNKIDLLQNQIPKALADDKRFVFISASGGKNIESLKDKIIDTVNIDEFKTGNTIVTNARHYESLIKTKEDLQQVIKGIDGRITNDFLALDIRQALYHLGEITGEITTDDLLSNIFSKFCIGK